MKRRITEQLVAWKKQLSGRMPLLVYGARQVGKTYILNEFGRQHYKNIAYINLETNQNVSSYFKENIEPEHIIRFLEVDTKEEILPEETLIFFDEIQSCERALTSLKYFNELAPNYHIVCAGSLLGVAINREHYSFPVGNVDSMTLFPFDFEEFLWANNEEKLSSFIRSSYDANEPLPAALHEKAIDLFKLYMIVGGMPAAISSYLERGSLLSVPDVQNKIINDYISDMAKYSSNSDSVKIRAAYNSIPIQLAKNNKKFQYKIAQRGGTSAIFGAVIDWLSFAGVALKCKKIEQAYMPISVYNDLSSFKLYMSDVGLLTMKSGMSQQAVLSVGKIDNSYIGAIVENYVAQQFASKHYDLFYWESDGKAEVDFVLQKGNDIIAVEVKAGLHTKSRSLSVFVDKYKPAFSIRISAKNFGFENNIKSVPLYAVFCI